MPYCNNTQCGEYVGDYSFCPKCGTKLKLEGVVDQKIKLSASKFASTKATVTQSAPVEVTPAPASGGFTTKGGPKSGVNVNSRAKGGQVRTFMPKDAKEREKLSDKLADRVLGNLSDLDLPGKKVKRSWKRK